MSWGELGKVSAYGARGVPNVCAATIVEFVEKPDLTVAMIS